MLAATKLEVVQAIGQRGWGLVGKTIQYVVVVHGMGEARQNETMLAVASRFAEARSGSGQRPPPSIVVPLGSATTQTGIDRGDGSKPDGLPWVEFSGIPAAPVPPADDPFYAQSSSSGDNLRFVDIHWNDLLTRDWPTVGQSPNIWLDGLLGRLIRKDRLGAPRVPQWILETLRTLGETVSLIHIIASLRAKDLDDLVFNKYLGDVQLYGEYPRTRGLAVRRFHERMTATLARHRQTNPDDEAEFTIIAHSLGTIMSADALVLSRADLLGFIEEEPAGNDHLLRSVLQGYFADGEVDRYRQIRKQLDDNVQLSSSDRQWQFEMMTLLTAAWSTRIKAFVTLGSPIDKFLIIWWLNYAYLRDSRIVEDSERIPHFNYCEEQDPVGHHLDVAYTAPAFAKVFLEKEDRVYTRYAIPGLAHIHYWDDLPLFDWILSQTVDKNAARQTPAKEPQWFVPGVYWWVVSIDYLILPLVVAAAHMLALNWAWNAEGINGVLLGGATFAITWLMGRYILDLFIWWRQVLKAKASIVEGGPFADSKKGDSELLKAARGQAIRGSESWMADVAAALFAVPRLVGWLLHWCKPPEPREGAAATSDHRQRWISERDERALVESRLRGLLRIIHLLALIMLATASLWYFACFAQWKDLARLMVLGMSVAAVIGAWLIAVHGEIASWQVGRWRGGFRVLCGSRLKSPVTKESKPASDSDRLATEGFFDCDIPGAIWMLVAASIGIALGAWVFQRKLPAFWGKHPGSATGILWASVGLSGAIGYTRTRLRRAKKLLAQDAVQKPIDFTDFFPPETPQDDGRPPSNSDSSGGTTGLPNETAKYELDKPPPGKPLGDSSKTVA